MEQEPSRPFEVLFAEFLEGVRTTTSTDQYSCNFGNILQEQQDELYLSRDDYLDQYVQALAKNKQLKMFWLAFSRFTDICFLKHLHSHGTLRTITLKFDPRDQDNSRYYDVDDETQDVEIADTLANFVGLKNLHIRAHHFTTGAPRFTQALLRGISQNSSLRSLRMFDLDDFGLQELDWTQSKLQTLEVGECDLSFSTWKSLLSIPSLESLELSTLSGGREEPGRIPRHVLSRNHVFRSLPEQCRSIRNLIINWLDIDSTDVERMVRFFDFERLTLDLTGLQLRTDEPLPPPEEFQEKKFFRICGLVDSANSKVSFIFEPGTISTVLADFPDVLRTILGFPAVVGMEITSQNDVGEWNPLQCLRVLTEYGGYLERLDISGIFEAQDDKIVKVISSLPRLQYLTAPSYPTPSFAEAVDAHLNLLEFDLFDSSCASDTDMALADRAGESIEASLCRNQANRFARRISSRTCSEAGAGLKLWPTILASVGKGDVAAFSGVFQAFRNDIGRFLDQEIVPETPPTSEKMAAGRKRSREEEAEE